MAFFRNSAVNLLNLHYAINSLAMNGGGAFFTAYLLKAGLPLPTVLASVTAILAGRFILRPLVLPAATRAGLRALVIAGTVIGALQYPLLAEVHGAGAMLFWLCLMTAAGDAVYWSTYHAYFAQLGDHESRGRQLGAREAIAAILGIVSPIATGWVGHGLLDRMEAMEQGFKDGMHEVDDAVEATGRAARAAVRGTGDAFAWALDIPGHVARHPWILVGAAVLVGLLIFRSRRH